ncbi:hypothetical protein H2200_005912 [Cladophialophora chaetospira]|uniref:DUF7918 domain-containing protein n=1 Tax=Cladophialophora chaetospira TaxID=386627 RepID=A0AA39CIS0_9EURO|nr:hypothetical protein H2200_005912 [Cladophialophora chaetospira]
MAILDKFEAQVFVDGIRAEEFDDDDENAGVLPVVKEITKYVEAVSGANFEFKFFAETSYNFTGEDAISFDVYVDGERITGKFLRESDFSKAKSRGLRAETNSSGKYSKEATGMKLYKFEFADLETRDMERTDDINTFKTKYGDLGTFRIEIWRIKLLQKYETNNTTIKDVGTVPEKALKGRPLDVATRLAPVAVSGTNYTYGSASVGKEPLAVIKFKYRTRRALQSLLILERSPTPVPLEERPIEELTREEMAELLTKQRERGSEVKEERNLKRERSPTFTNARPLKSSKGNNGETIFHLDSDDEDGTDDDDVKEVPAPKRTVEIVDLI